MSFPHLYSTDVSGVTPDTNAVRSVARADVAELCAALEPAIAIDDNVHVVNIATKRAVTATEFKQMFYARGDDEFSIANVYDHANISSNILASVWGKRVDSTGVVLTGTVLTATNFAPVTHVISVVNTLSVGDQVLITCNVAETTLVLDGVTMTAVLGIAASVLATVTMVTGTTVTTSLNVGVVNSHSATLTLVGGLPYNTSEVMNYNKLSGRVNDPSGTGLAYGYATDLQRNFYASHEVIGNLEKDLCVKRENWTLCSRIAVEDQLQSLAFSAEESDDVCMKVNCARKWSEVEDALAESCLAENNLIALGDYVDLFINVRVTNGNPDTNDTIIRIRFTVQLTRGTDDLGNWNVVASNAASVVLTTGIPYDAHEGGSLQHANASQVETNPAFAETNQVQAPTTNTPGDLDAQVS